MLQANHINLLMIRCNVCNYQFRSDNCTRCSKCEGETSIPILNPFEKESLIALVQSNPYRNDRYDNWNYNHYQEKMEFRDRFKVLLQNLEWYDHSRITMQACWIALFIVKERNHNIIFALSFFEDAFADALPKKKAEMEDAIFIDIWERNQQT